MRATLVASLLVACGSVHFTDPQAPQLFLSTAEYQTGAAAEPVVWLPILDVWSEKADGCDGARAWTLQAIRGAMLAADPKGRELDAADLSPTCEQSPSRTLDLTTLRQEVQSAAAADPSAHVRVVVVYANNIGIPVSGPIVDALQTLRAAGLLWTVARPAVSTQLSPSRSIEWTYTFDNALQQQLTSAATTDLPLQSDTGTDSGLRPVLGAADLPKARAAKFCAATDGLALVRLSADGNASSVDLAAPPMFQVRFAQRYAVLKSEFAPQSAHVEVEGCSGNCDGYFTAFPGDLRRWDTTTGCFLEAP